MGRGSDAPFCLFPLIGPFGGNGLQFEYEIRIRRIGYEVRLTDRFQSSKKLGVDAIGLTIEGLGE